MENRPFGMPSKPSVKVELVDITPERAQYLLNTDDSNRKISQPAVAKYVKEMETGWEVNGSTIVLDENSRLLDGQHRLRALIKIGRPQKMLIVYGVKRELRNTIDTGRSRSAADNLGMLGYKNRTALSGTARFLVGTKAGVVQPIVTNREIVEFVEARPELPQSVARIHTKDLSLMGVPRVTASWHYIAQNLSPHHEMVERALRVLEHGIPEYQGDAMHSFRERMLKGVDREWFKQSEGNYPLFYTMVGAWNNFVRREPVRNTKTRMNPIDMIGVDYSKI